MSFARYFRGKIFWLLHDSAVSRIFGSMLGASIRRDGFSVKFATNTSPTARTCIFFGIYELPERRLIARWLPAELDCVELGSSIGIVSLAIRRKLRPDRKLAAVEALPDLAGVCRENLAVNFSEHRNWRVLDGAIFYGPGRPRMSIGRENTQGRLAAEGGDPTGIEVPALTLRQILAAEKIGDYSLVADIEGAEFDLLKHEPEALARCRLIIVEVHGDEPAKRQFEEDLAALGFNVVGQKHSTLVFARSSP